MADRYIKTELIFDSESIAAGANSVSDAKDLASYRPMGYFSLELAVSGSGTIKAEYQISNSGQNYKTPASAVPIVASHSATSGPDGDGIERYRFNPKPCRFLKIKLTEVGGADLAVASAYLLIQ